MKPLLIFSIALLSCAAAMAQQAPAQPAPQLPQWGTILGRIVYDGKGQFPKPRMVPINKALIPGLPAQIDDESLVVNKENSGLANVFVYLRTKPSKIHPGYEQGAAKEQILRVKNHRFVPHAMALWNKDVLELQNEENFGVGVKYDSLLQSFYVLLDAQALGAANNVKKQFDRGEFKPGTLSDNVYPWKSGQLLIRDNPYFCVTDERGIFCIPNLPAGEELEFVFWHERVGGLKNIKSNATTFTINEKSRLPMKLTQPVTDLGEFKLDPKLFEE